MGGGGVCQLHMEVALVPTAIQTLRVGPTAGEVFLVDTVPKGVWYSAHDGQSHFTGHHFAQLYFGCFAVERRVRGHYQIRGIFEGGVP